LWNDWEKKAGRRYLAEKMTIAFRSIKVINKAWIKAVIAVRSEGKHWHDGASNVPDFRGRCDADGGPFFVMELVRGSKSDYCIAS